jgi:hypothetical protein
MVMPMPCAVCHGGMGHGQATFTAECSHTFHPRTACPICFTAWHDVPGVTPTQPLLFHDDEPLDTHPRVQATVAGGGGVMVLKTHYEYLAVARDASRNGFAALVHANAPALAPTAAKAARAAGPRHGARRQREHVRP